MELEKAMRRAIKQAYLSYRKGGNGFGAVIEKDGKTVAYAFDDESGDCDPTSHAPIKAIRNASKKLGKDLSGCVLVTTMEPCPMCSAAIVWANISEVAYGYSQKQMMYNQKPLVNLASDEVFGKSYSKIRVHPGILADDCAVLYRNDVIDQIKKLRGADDWDLSKINRELKIERYKWFQENKKNFKFLTGNPLDQAYALVKELFGISDSIIPISYRDEKKLVTHWQFFCPTLEACNILGLDTRKVCRTMFGGVTDSLLKNIDPRLGHSIDYESIRPRKKYCEECFTLKDK